MVKNREKNNLLFCNDKHGRSGAGHYEIVYWSKSKISALEKFNSLDYNKRVTSRLS